MFSYCSYGFVAPLLYVFLSFFSFIHSFFLSFSQLEDIQKTQRVELTQSDARIFDLLLKQRTTSRGPQPGQGQPTQRQPARNNTPKRSTTWNKPTAHTASTTPIAAFQEPFRPPSKSTPTPMSKPARGTAQQTVSSNDDSDSDGCQIVSK